MSAHHSISAKNYPIPKDLAFVGISIRKGFVNKEQNRKIFASVLENYREESFDFIKYKSVKLRPAEWPDIFRYPNDPEKLKNKFYSRRDCDDIEQVSELFWYHFSDGLCISSRVISLHPLRKLIPGLLLPDPDDGHNGQMDYGPWVYLTHKSQSYYKWPELKTTERMMQGLLRRVISAVNAGNLKFFIQEATRPSNIIKINAIVENFKEKFIWQASCSSNPWSGSLVLVPQKTPSTWEALDAGGVDPVDGLLSLHSFKNEIEMVKQVMSYYGPCGVQILSDASSFHSTDSSGKNSHDHFGIVEISDQETLFHGLEDLKARGYQIHFLGGSYNISMGGYESEIHLSRSGDFHLSYGIKTAGDLNLSLKFSGVTRQTCNVLFSLKSGIPQVLGYEAKDMASRSYPKREWDMKLLKHLGIFQYLILELCSVVLEGQLTDGTVVKNRKKVFSQVSDNILNLLKNGLDLPPGTSLEKLCSAKVLEYFEKFVKWFFENYEAQTKLYTSKGEITLEDLNKKDLQVVYALLKDYVLAVGGSCFQKSRSSFVEKFSKAAEENLKSMVLKEVSQEKTGCLEDQDIFNIPSVEKSSLSLLASLQVLRPLTENGFRLCLDGRPLEELAEGDFSVEFALNEAAHDNDGANGTTVENGTKTIDWFELNPKFFLKGKELDTKGGINISAGGIIEYQGKLYLVPRKQIPSLSRLESFWLRLQQGTKKGKLAPFSEKVLAMPRSQVLELLALRASGYPVQGGKEWEDICVFYDSLGTKRKSLKFPHSINAELKPYQKEGVEWLHDLYSLKMGALLGDDMGLGKTLQTLSFLEVLRVSGKLGPTLIVVPPSLVYNWQSEAEKFVPKLSLQIFSTKHRDRLGQIFSRKVEGESSVLIVTYGLLAENEALFSSVSWNIVIFDEAQNLKNIIAKRTTAARALRADFKLCLTGTPMENHYGEFYSLVDLIVPGSLGDIDEFRQRYVNTTHILSEDIDHLRLKVKPLILRRTKKEILSQLPEKVESKVSISFESTQKKLYRDVAISYNEKIQQTIKESGESKCQLQMLTALLRLRQICSDPSALPNITYKKVPPKLETLLDSVKEVVESGESALVFTQFLSTLSRVEEILKKESVCVYTIHGGVSTEQRQKVLKGFEECKTGAVLLMTLKTGGVGLNLTKASYVFHLEPWWNPAVENQATDRAHRMGQEKSVQVYRYIMHESVEEKIELLKDRKANQFRTLFADMENESEVTSKPGSSRLTKEDFDLLIKQET